MKMHDEPEYENLATMDGIFTPVIKPLSPVDDPEIKRTRKILLIILSICLALSATNIIILPILWIVIMPEKTITPQAAQIGQLLISVLFYTFGIFIVYRYHQKGLRVFGWLCIICLIILGIAIVALLSFLVIALIAMNHTHDVTAALASATMVLIIFIILCLTAFIVTVIIVKFTFKLARLINDNKPLTTQQV